MSSYNYDVTSNYNYNSTVYIPADTTEAGTEKPLFPCYFENKSKSALEKFSLSLFIPKSKQEKINIPKIGNISNPFGEKTNSLMYKKQHKTHLLDVAQNHLGIQEVTEDEYYKLSSKDINNTQMHVIGKFGTFNHQWCAHAVSHIAKEANINIGKHKKSVQAFIDWGKANNTYNSIYTNSITPSNFITERYSRESQIKEQIKNMHEGDFIIWKSDFVAILPNHQIEESKASHIGILESVNSDGSITVIEGNANEYKTDKAERESVVTGQEGIYGNQEIGEFQEVNRRDGLIRKTYTAQNLAAFGYSGYIDNQKIVK